MSHLPSLERIFFECLDQGTPEERAAYLARACAGDAELLLRVQRMLAAHDGSFLEQPAYVPAPPEPASAEQAGQRVGTYRLVEPIGEGGMGTVWRAEQVEPVQRQVALKLIKAGMDSRQVIARFEAERQALALMDHPNIARVLDGGADSAGRPYFVMDLFPGVPITRYCDERRLPLRQRLELFALVCEAIQHAHQKGVIHRDIKPSNVLVALQDGRAVPKVIDFGIAKAIEQKLSERSALTQQGGLIGTLEYMSPEQSVRSAEGVDTRSDIYSLGVLLYELLTGSTPLTRRLLEQASLPDILRVIADDETPKPSTRLRESGAATAAIAARRGVERARLASLVSGELDWIVMKALEKDRDRRYATAADLAQDVQRFLVDEPVQAGPPSAAYRLRKFARRNRGALAAASVLVAALLVAIGGIGWAVGDRAARKAEDERVASERRARVLATVQELLEAAEREMAAQDWPEALATVRRADAAATSGEADAETAQSVRVLLQGLEFVERLDRIRSRPTTWTSSSFNSAGAVREYLQAFREHGVDIESAPLEAQIERLGTTPALAIPLAAGLDDMARRSLEARMDPDLRRRLVRVADAIDPEPTRASIRAYWVSLDPSVEAELARLAGSIDVRAQHPATLSNLEWTLRLSRPDTARALLRAARHAHPGDFWLAFQLGAALDAEDADEALLYCTAAVAIRPDSAAAHTNLGHVLILRGDPDAAIASSQRASELDPKLSIPHMNMGRAHMDKGQLDQGLACMRTALELDPRSALAWVGLGTVLLEMGQLVQAGDAFQRALELEPKHIHAIVGMSNVQRGQGKLPEALATARQATAAEPARSHGYIALGNALAQSGAYAESITAFRKAIELDPRDAVAPGNLGNSLLALGDPALVAEALALCRKSVALNPRYAIGHLALGNALLADGQDDAALAAYRKAAELVPTLEGAYLGIGKVAWRLGHLEEALSALHKAVELRPGNANARFAIASLHIQRNEHAEAETALREGIQLEPGNANAHHSLGAVLRSLDRQEESLAAKRRAAEIEPDVASRHLAVAASLYEQRRFDEAVPACRKAIELDPRSKEAHALLGLVLRLQDKLAEAIDPLEQAIRLDPRDASLTGVLAALLAICPDPKLRNGPRALELARKAVELEPAEASHSRTLGLALYCAGEWQAALAALEVVSKQAPDNSGFDSFYVAMAHHQLGDAVAARAAYDRGCECIARARAVGPDVRRAHEEASALLGIELPPR